VGPRASLDNMEKRKFLTLTGLKLRLLGCPAHSQLLYRLCYSGSYFQEVIPKVIMSEKSDINVGPILNGFTAMSI
jgi:hypothetical protein